MIEIINKYSTWFQCFTEKLVVVEEYIYLSYCNTNLQILHAVNVTLLSLLKTCSIWFTIRLVSHGKANARSMKFWQGLKWPFCHSKNSSKNNQGSTNILVGSEFRLNRANPRANAQFNWSHIQLQIIKNESAERRNQIINWHRFILHRSWLNVAVLIESKNSYALVHWYYEYINSIELNLHF